MADSPNSLERVEDNEIIVLALPITPDDQNKSVSGRLLYLNAISECCDGFWESLRDRVLFSCEFFELRALGKPHTKEMLQAAQSSLDAWLWDYQVRDGWIVQTCHYTLASWAVFAREYGRSCLINKPLQAFYGPTEASLDFALRPFAPIFDQPYPVPAEPLSANEQAILDGGEPVGRRIYEASVPRESSRDFKKRMRRQFEQQLTAYAARREAQILEQKNTRRDADWTALYQGGLSPKEIENWEHGRSGDDFSQARILQAVNKFAVSIGLTLRPPKAGRKAKSSSGAAPNSEI